MFNNKYTCPDCGLKWESHDEAQPDDDCSACGSRHISPRESVALSPAIRFGRPSRAATPWRLIDWEYYSGDDGEHMAAIVGADYSGDDEPLALVPDGAPHAELMRAAPEYRAVLQSFVDAWSEYFDADREINGGDAVEFLAGYFADCRRVLAAKGGAA